MKLKHTILNLVNQYPSVQVACTYSNVCRWQYLTTSGLVCTQEHGYIEDWNGDEDGHVRIDLPDMTIATVIRLQRAIANLYTN